MLTGATREGECKGMADRIISMREMLKSRLETLGSTRDWSHVTKQIGMFCFTVWPRAPGKVPCGLTRHVQGLSKEQVSKMITEHHVYMTGDGRISVAGLTEANIEHVARSMHAVTEAD